MGRFVRRRRRHAGGRRAVPRMVGDPRGAGANSERQRRPGAGHRCRTQRGRRRRRPPSRRPRAGPATRRGRITAVCARRGCTAATLLPCCCTRITTSSRRGSASTGPPIRSSLAPDRGRGCRGVSSSRSRPCGARSTMAHAHRQPGAPARGAGRGSAADLDACMEPAERAPGTHLRITPRRVRRRGHGAQSGSSLLRPRGSPRAGCGRRGRTTARRRR